ncbi:MAG: serine acetyltransferase, partial [Armatimonadetes bacterium]|nr:serine acetyltransferase [Armatimonadota bacterium]
GGKTVIGKGSIIGGNIWLTHSVSPHSKIILEEQKQKITSLEGREKVFNF